MKYKYTRKEIVEKLNLAHRMGRAVTGIDGISAATISDLIRDLLEKQPKGSESETFKPSEEKCDCKTKYCKHYESDFDRFCKENPISKPSLPTTKVDKALKQQRAEVLEVIKSMKRPEYDVDKLHCDGCGSSDPEECSCDGFNEALDQLLSQLNTPSGDTKEVERGREMNILERIWEANHQLTCVVCGGSVLMLPGDKQEDGPAHLFCQMWGHPISEHDYENPKVFMTEKYKRFKEITSPK